MKVLITVISSLFVGLALASSNFSPIQELQYFIGNKRRLMTAAGVAVTGYIAVIAGVLMGLVEGALQYDAQGFVMWSSLFTVAAILCVIGVASLFAFRAMVPPRPAVHETLFSDLSRQFNVAEILESLIRRTGEARSEDQAQREEREEEVPKSEEKFRESVARPAPETVFRETPTADVFHH